MKPKKCKACKGEFQPFLSMQKACSPMCAISIAKTEEAKKERADTRARKLALKTKSQWLIDAQKVFNKYIRARDKKQACISCGINSADNSFTGGKYDTGHFFSVGAHPAMRFDERNAHKQCVKCNRNLSGNIHNYRINLIEKMGRKAFHEFEAQAYQAKPKKYSIDDLKELIKYYRQKIKDIKQ